MGKYIMGAYDDALVEILNKGVRKENRTGVDTIAVFGIQKKYDISENFPLLTRRKMKPEAIFGELLWFLSGSTKNQDLQAHGSNIWTPWATLDETKPYAKTNKAFLKKHGFEEGDFGPVYGFQLRHFGANYKLYHSLKKRLAEVEAEKPKVTGNEAEDKKEQEIHDIKVKTNRNILKKESGFDQLAYIVKELKTNKFSRRILFSLWNPNDLDMMRLPPCHYTFQLYVDNDNRLSGALTQRSCDYPIGVPANIQFYSTLIYMLAQQCNLIPYEFVHNTMDAHIYVDQIDAVKEYLARPIVDSPKLELNKAKDIESYQMSDFKVVDYNPQPHIKIPVAV